MIKYIGKRLLYMVITLLIISVVDFVIIQLPPGDYLTTYIANLEAAGGQVSENEIAALREFYGLDKPIYTQYINWIYNFLCGDMGYSFEWNRPVSELIGQRLALTLAISFLSLVFTYLIAIPIGVYSAIRQYSLGDYLFTIVGFIGLAIPAFLFAMLLMFISFRYFGFSVGGLFSPEYVTASWSFAKIIDLLKHVWVPVVVIGTGGACGLIRVMRSSLLNELRKQYVTTARAKGLSEWKLLWKYPIRIAINPIISTVAWVLPAMISGSTIVSIVLNLPTCGPMLLSALQSQDMYLAGGFLLILATLTVIGTSLSDVLLALCDPRIRLSGRSEK